MKKLCSAYAHDVGSAHNYLQRVSRVHSSIFNVTLTNSKSVAQ